MWSNMQPDCDQIEGERKSGTAEYVAAFKVPGVADNKHDAAPTPGVVNTYRLRCEKGGVYSGYSNEMSGTP
jgi:heme/copper-type cytochrome/quinol oxidase subunit 2